jgi:hypothetical protein
MAFDAILASITISVRQQGAQEPRGSLHFRIHPQEDALQWHLTHLHRVSPLDDAEVLRKRDLVQGRAPAKDTYGYTDMSPGSSWRNPVASVAYLFGFSWPASEAAERSL